MEGAVVQGFRINLAAVGHVINCVRRPVEDVTYGRG